MKAQVFIGKEGRRAEIIHCDQCQKEDWNLTWQSVAAICYFQSEYMVRELDFCSRMCRSNFEQEKGVKTCLSFSSCYASKWGKVDNDLVGKRFMCPDCEHVCYGYQLLDSNPKYTCPACGEGQSWECCRVPNKDERKSSIQFGLNDQLDKYNSVN